MAMLYVKAYIATAVVFFTLDYIWLSRMTGSFYRPLIGSLMLDQPRLGVAALFYVIYVAGVVVFAVAPALRAESVVTALMLGALLGGIAYGTYDITNYATLRNWPVMVLVVDVAWGMALTAVSAGAGYLLTRLI